MLVYKLNIRKQLILFIAILLTIINSTSAADSLSIKKLELVARAWGFVVFKTEKKISNPDKELIKLIQSSLKDKSLINFRNEIEHWVNKNLKTPNDSNCVCFNYTLPESLIWTTDTSLLGQSLAKTLAKAAIQCNKKNNPQYKLNGPIPIFYNVKSNKDLSFPDLSHRLLACIKYWNIVNYFYSYPQNCVPNWSISLTQLLESFIEVSNYKDYYFSLLRMSHILNDGHARIYSEWASDSLFTYQVPFETEVYEDFAIVTFIDSASKCDIRKGDKIIEINHEKINKKLSDWSTLLSTSTRGWFLHTIRNYLFASADSNMNFTILRNSDTALINVVLTPNRLRSQITENAVYTMTQDSIGYINIGNLQLHHLDAMKSQLQESKVIIIDARNYPNSTMIGLSAWIVDAKRLFARHARQNPTCLGKNNINDSSTTVFNDQKMYQGTILLLIDRSTISQGEFLAMDLMQSSNVITIGRPTAGANGVTSRFQLPGNIECRITTSGIYFPDYSLLQQKGIQPSIDLSESVELLTSDDILSFSYHYARKIIIKK